MRPFAAFQQVILELSEFLFYFFARFRLIEYGAPLPASQASQHQTAQGTLDGGAGQIGMESERIAHHARDIDGLDDIEFERRALALEILPLLFRFLTIGHESVADRYAIAGRPVDHLRGEAVREEQVRRCNRRDDILSFHDLAEPVPELAIKGQVQRIERPQSAVVNDEIGGLVILAGADVDRGQRGDPRAVVFEKACHDTVSSRRLARGSSDPLGRRTGTTGA